MFKKFPKGVSDKGRPIGSICMMKLFVAGQEQTDSGLNQRTGIVQVDQGGLSCGQIKSDDDHTNSSNSLLHPLPTSPVLPALHITQR